MENTSYALHIAVGVLIAIAILSLILFGWRKIGTLEKAKDTNIAVKNKADFNAEYEAYNKNLMYGTDVLSCLNKAQNNNQKYVYNNYYGTDLATIGKAEREEFFIDVEVTLHSTLKEEVKAYYRDKSGKYHRAVGLGNDATTVNNYNDVVFGSSSTNRFKIPTIYYYYFQNGVVYQATLPYTDIMWNGVTPNPKTLTLYKILENGTINTNVVPGTYNLLSSAESTTTPAGRREAAMLSALLSTVNLKSQELTNGERPSVYEKSDWWYCTWTTAANDFKTKKFKCDGVEYDDVNGYVNKIKFSEY